MLVFVIIVTVGLIYAACVFEPNLLWFIGAAALVQIVINFIFKENKEHKKLYFPEDEVKVPLIEFTDSLRHSIMSKRFDQEEARERLTLAGARDLVAIYRGIKPMVDSFNLTDVDEDAKQDALQCIANLDAIGEIILNELADRQIEAYRHSKREVDGNYARVFATSISANLFSENLTDEQVLENVAKIPYNADLVHIVLDTDREVFDSTSEITTGSEEEMERYYHNNLRKIQFLLRQELAKRVIAKESRHRFF